MYIFKYTTDVIINMMLRVIAKDILSRYMRIDTKWLLLSYALTILFAVVLTKIGKKRGLSVIRCILTIFLFFYLFTVCLSTIIGRPILAKRIMNLSPFWSWKKMIGGNRYWFIMVAENILMLMPIGFFMPFINRSNKYFIKTVGLGFLFSLIIEILQYIFKVGMFEIDDLLNNTFGVFISCSLATLFKGTYKYMRAIILIGLDS